VGGPELVSVSSRAVESGAVESGVAPLVELTLIFSNATLSLHKGIYVGKQGVCTTPVAQRTNTTAVAAVAYKISDNKITAFCTPSPSREYSHTVLVNSYQADCFVYGPTGLPAPPIEATCA
jgi:hypothetical protein